MKILHIIDSLEIGGMERLVVDLVKEQKNRGHHPSVICIYSRGVLAQELDVSQIPVISLNKTSGLSISHVRHIQKYIRQEKITIVHTHNASSNLYGAIAGFLSGTKVINTRHGMGNFPYDKKREAIYKFSSIFVSTVVLVCRKACENFTQTGIVSPKKARIIYNGVALKKFRPKESYSTHTHFVIGIVARLEAVKNIPILLRASALARKTIPGLRVHIIGDGQQLGALKALSEELKISDMVDFKGARHDIPNLLAELDAFILPSQSEGMSLTLIEAMASGLPVIASDVGGNPEVITNQCSGILVEAGNIENLSSEIIRLAENEQLRASLGKAAYERAHQLFSLETMCTEYEKAYVK